MSRAEPVVGRPRGDRLGRLGGGRDVAQRLRAVHEPVEDQAQGIVTMPDYIFEDEPADILNTMLTLYFSATIMRCMQESVASELASRMTAMQSASNNAKKRTGILSQIYNRARQATVTNEILEISAGAAALADAE